MVQHRERGARGSKFYERPNGGKSGSGGECYECTQKVCPERYGAILGYATRNTYASGMKDSEAVF